MAKIQIKIKPNAKTSVIHTLIPLVIHLKSPATEGKANKELIRFLSSKLKIPQSLFQITHGHQSRLKILDFPGLTEAELRQRLLSTKDGTATRADTPSRARE